MAAPALGLRDGDRKCWAGWVRSRSVPAGLAQRARILLLTADGVPNVEMAETVGMSRPTINLWRNRYRQSGLAGLDDRPKSGAAPHDRCERDLVGDVDAAAEKVGEHALVVAAAGGSVEDGRDHGAAVLAVLACSPSGRRRSSSPPTRSWSPRSPMSSASIWSHPRTRSCSVWTRSRRSRRLTGPDRCCRCGPP